ncbi:MAG: hypothetical protein ACRDP6_36190 [Actinoallomurus sp.]
MTRTYRRRVLPLVLAFVAVATACSDSGTRPRPARSAYNPFVILPSSRHVTYSTQAPAGHCLLGGTPPQVYPLWLCVPGAIVSGVNASNYHQTGCRPDYERRMRPPAAEIEGAKRRLREEFGPRIGTDWRLDWLVPLSLGGANDIRNLWPAPVASAKLKRGVDADLRRAVCGGTVGLAAAQTAISVNWTSAKASLGIE